MSKTLRAMFSTYKIKLFLVLIQLFYFADFSNARDNLCVPQPSREAVAVYRLLNDYKNQYILSGQQDSYMDGTTAYVNKVTSKYPAIRGFDFMTQSHNGSEVYFATKWWKSGGIPTIMWHWGAPTMGEGFEASQKKINIDNCFIEGTAEYQAFWSELIAKGKLLTQLRDSGVPVIWRPFHELNGGWFWWGKGGPLKFKKLWTTMFNYYTKDLHLNNLIWTLCYTSEPNSFWYPGDSCVDIIGSDLYNGGDGPQELMYDKVAQISNVNLPIAYHECGLPPQPEQCIEQNAMWSWWMEWSGTEWIKSIDVNYLQYLYNHDVIVSRDELPDIMNTYNWNDTCSADEVLTYMKADTGDWKQTNKIPYETNSEFIHLKVETKGEGTWSWHGYGVKDSSIVEQKVKLNGMGSIEVVFTNNCGAITTKTFHISQGCLGTPIIPYIYYGGVWRNTNEISIQKGQSILFGPHPITVDGWEWTGPNLTSKNRELNVTPDSSCTYIAKYTNECGKTTTSEFRILVDYTDIDTYNENNLEIIIKRNFGEFTMKFNCQIPQNLINIYNLNGVKVFSKNIIYHNETITLSDIESGFYIVEVINSNERILKKIFI